MTHEQAVEKQAAERYLLEDMPELERFAFEEHLFACPICAEDVRTGGVMQEGVKAGLLPPVKAEGKGQKAEKDLETSSAQAPKPSKFQDFPPSLPRATADKHVPSPTTSRPQDLKTRRPRDAWRGAMPWAAAALLAVSAGYQALWVVPNLRQQIIGPTVLSPVTLRGASRGTEPTLTRPAAGVLALAVDLAGVAAGASLTYDLRAADGVSVASGTAAAPPPGTPLLLLIPASALDSTGRYTLSVGTSGAPGAASLDFKFTVSEVRSESER